MVMVLNVCYIFTKWFLQSSFTRLWSVCVCEHNGRCKSVSDHVICPWVHQYSNLVSYQHQLAAITIPDVCPSDVSGLKDFSMSAGDFLQVYTNPGTCVCVCVWLCHQWSVSITIWVTPDPLMLYTVLWQDEWRPNFLIRNFGNGWGF